MPQKFYVEIDDAIIHNKIAFNQYVLTLNYNYLAYMLFPEYLLKSYKYLPSELKTITEQLTIDDNPVLMLMKLK